MPEPLQVKIILDGQEHMVPAREAVLCDIWGNQIAIKLEPIFDVDVIEVTRLDSPGREFITDGLCRL